MKEVLSDLGRYVRRPALLGYIATIYVGWLAYTATMYAITGAWGSAWGYVDVAVFQLLLAFVQAGLVRYFGKEVIVLAPPRVIVWIALTAMLALGVYALAFAAQVLAYLVAKDAVAAVSWHPALEGATAVAILFPFTVWQVALLAGERRVGLRRAWKGVWRDRPGVVAIAFAVFAVIAIAAAEAETATPADAGVIEVLFWAIPLMLPGAVGYVILILLAFVTFLAIERDIAAQSATFE